MDKGLEWFAAKRYGYGAGLPISWQGWAVSIAFIGIVAASGYFLGDQPLMLLGIVVPLALALMIVTAKTTRGGWRWRWGEKD
jgi:hypothetical protein